MTQKPSYEQIAESHWKRWRPTEYEAMSPTERTEFFRSLAQLVTAQKQATWRAIAGPDKMGETTQEKLARNQTAQMLAESDAIREILLPDPEPGLRESPETAMDEEPDDPTGRENYPVG